MSPQALRQSVLDALAHAPDPARALSLAGEVIEAAEQHGLRELTPAALERLPTVMLALCGVAPFFASYLRRRPEWLLALLRDELAQPRSPETYAAAAAALPGEGAAELLRRLKYFELARITARDCDEQLVPLARAGETLRELTWLADALLSRALEVAQARVAQRSGPPRWRNEAGGDEQLAFAVLGLGKLGAEELNYSSDVDLVYVHEAPALPIDTAHDGPGYAALPPAEYFAQLAQQFGKLVGDTTAEGFLYRIDLELRPEGAQGTLVVSDETLASYYENWADTWEKATFMKARPVAGDLGFGWRAIRAVDPMIYRTAMDYAAVDAIRKLKDKIEAAHGRREDAWNVKLDAGGIRDIEFIAQALQLLHGGRIGQIRARSTQDALERLRDVHLLSDADCSALLDAYRFLRRLENRLQMVEERQTHRLPADAPARAFYARAMGYRGEDASERFDAALRRHQEDVRGRFTGLLYDGGDDHLFELFARRVPQLLAAGASRDMLHALAEHFAREIGASSHPQRALNNLDRFIEGVGQRRFYFELLLDRPELVPRLTALFASSNYLSALLASHPTLIEPVFYDPNVLLLARGELQADFDAILTETRARVGDEHEAQLDALRLFYHRQIINAGLLDLGGKIDRRALEAALTDIAEVCVERALAFAQPWLVQRRPELAAAAQRTRFMVVGMGKLASSELSYGSDLDLVFVFDVDDTDGAELIEAQEYCARLSQRLISLLSTSTAEGFCYEIDARLRPSGNQGTLVSSLPALARYHESDAQVWERMALLRARPVAGDAELGRRFSALREAILARPLPDDARSEVVHVRRRMERELAKESARRRDFKRGRGGMLDVENIVQYLQLQGGAAHPELFTVERVEVQLARLASLGLLAADQSAPLLDGWNFLQGLSARLRVVENRSISDLDEERGDLDGLAASLGYAQSGREGASRRALLADYRRHTEAIRAAYERILGSAE
jgi:glutamate-ammonia-ligase adenylyltransferase